MDPFQKKTPAMEADVIEERRLQLLSRLEVESHPLAIFYDLDTSPAVAFTISKAAAQSIRKGLSNPFRRMNESSALATVKVAALTPDKEYAVYELTHFVFENMGTADAVLSIERERLAAGEIEVHTHLFRTPDYLGQTDVGDLIAAVEGPAWVHPTNKAMYPALRIFGILSIYEYQIAQLQFYMHDLREDLTAANNYGLKKLGLPLTLKNAY